MFTKLYAIHNTSSAANTMDANLAATGSTGIYAVTSGAGAGVGGPAVVVTPNPLDNLRAIFTMLGMTKIQPGPVGSNHGSLARARACGAGSCTMLLLEELGKCPL